MLIVGHIAERYTDTFKGIQGFVECVLAHLLLPYKHVQVLEDSSCIYAAAVIPGSASGSVTRDMVGLPPATGNANPEKGVSRLASKLGLGRPEEKRPEQRGNPDADIVGTGTLTAREELLGGAASHPASAIPSGAATPTGHNISVDLTKLAALASSECIYCGSVMIDRVQEPFIRLPEEQALYDSWAL